jgi:hypothetical protein
VTARRGPTGAGWFEGISPEELDQADLFFADLMGTRRPKRTRRTSPKRPAARRRPRVHRAKAFPPPIEARALIEGPLTESEWDTIVTILTVGEAQVGAPLTADADRNALLVAARVFCDRNALNLVGGDPLLCVVNDVTMADPRVRALVPHVTARGPIEDWTKVARDTRIRRAMTVLVRTYGYPVNAAAGLAGNLHAESGVMPPRLEGSREATPMRTKDFSGRATDFTADAIRTRNVAAGTGPKLPGVGLAQWTSASRRRGLFARTFRGVSMGVRILFDMDAQVDYLVSELRSPGFAGVERVLTGAGVTADDACDEVVYNFEVPGALLADGRKLPRTDSRVQAVFRERRALAAAARRVWDTP